MSSPGSAPDGTREDVQTIFTQLDYPSTPLTATEVATKAECPPQTARDCLNELAERGKLRTKPVDEGDQVWWQPAEGTVTAEKSDQEEFAAFVSAVKDYAIFMLDPDGVVSSWNEGAERIKGYTEDEIVGEHFSTFYTEEETADGIPERNIERAAAEGRVEDEGWRVRADGSRFWANVTITAIRDDDGTLRGFTKVTRDMTERREYEQRLQRERDQTEQLLRTAPIAIAVQNTEGETVMANRRAQETLGLSEQEFFGEPDEADEWEIYNANYDPISPEETPSARVLATEEPVFDEELIIEPPDRGRLHFRVNATPLFDSEGEIERVVMAGKDITELKNRERQLERRTDELETELGEIFERISDAFYALDDEFRFTHINEQAAEVMQRSRDDLLGRKLWNVTLDATEDIYREQFRTALETQESVSFEMYEEELDAWLEFNVYPSETGLSIYFHEITDRKEYQRKLEESNERLEQFAYAASHDLQEPLRMVSSYLQLIEQRYGDELDEDGEEFLEFAIDGADRMRDMIEALLEYSRVETQGNPLEPVDLDTVVSRVCTDLQVKIEESNARIEAESLPQARGDENQLQQVFQNLLSNAIEYSGDDPPQIEIFAERDGGQWTISVRDEGIGIDPADHERVFRVFERLHSREEHSGTGIGLAISRRIIERHGGEVWVDSEPGEWTTFSFTLPAAAKGDS